MSSPQQASYIRDLAVTKTKEFKEVRELLYSNGIVAEASEVVARATTVSEICNALTDEQASRLIDALIAAEEPNRSTEYSENRQKKAFSGLEDIIATIDDWGFDGLR